ncbi:hypothetical protein DOM22_13440 [Bdellovibrio sp. ZAP7]|uniref:hypothetical protein n=1 Tax=Bdellovibrio sp. ZAP7 TaxID=2231053 RepID=UPI001158848D|nr:hypothetical protein [Bdellovibrio sp. ZAP7]QDK46090.1 hypothetical protein DOM22_13440 [Bdellovibrio sp. ZAP7]
MNKLLCALLVLAIPHVSFAAMEARIENGELRLSLNSLETTDVTVTIDVVPESPVVDENMVKHRENHRKIAELDSYIRHEVEAMAVKSGMSSQADLSEHKRNINNAEELKRTLAREVLAWDGLGTANFGSESRGGGKLTLTKVGTYRIPVKNLKQEWSGADLEESAAKFKITVRSGKTAFRKSTVINATEAELSSGKFQFEIGSKALYLGGGTCKQVFN